VTYCLNFVTPPYLGNVKLETSNLARVYRQRGALTKKSKIRTKGVVNRSHDLFLEFWDPLRVSGTVEARNNKCGTNINCSREALTKMPNKVKGVM